MNDDRTFVKIKIKSLAEESRMIRREESKIRKRDRRRAQILSKMPEDRTKVEQDKLDHMNLCSARDWSIKYQLRQHRINDVRTEARAANVAYAFLRGYSYWFVEMNPKSQPDWTRVRSIVQKYATHNLLGETPYGVGRVLHYETTDNNTHKTMDQFDKWVIEAREHYESCMLQRQMDATASTQRATSMSSTTTE